MTIPIANMLAVVAALIGAPRAQLTNPLLTASAAASIASVPADTARYDVTRQIVECMTTPEGFVETATTFAYYIPPTIEGQEQLLEQNPELEPWVEAVNNAQGRTGNGLGTDYPLISEALRTADELGLFLASVDLPWMGDHEGR